MKASSAQLNWSKCESLQIRKGRAGLKYPRVFVGTSDYQNKNWLGSSGESMCEIVSVELDFATVGESAGHQASDCKWHRDCFTKRVEG